MSPCLGSKKRPPKKTRTCHKKWVNQWLTNRHAFPKVFVYFMLPHLAWRKKRKRSLEQKHLRRAALHCTRKPWDIYLVSRESSAKWRADGVIRIRQLERRGFWVVYKYYQSNFGSRGEIKGGIIYVCVCVCERIFCMCLRVSERERDAESVLGRTIAARRPWRTPLTQWSELPPLNIDNMPAIEVVVTIGVAPWIVCAGHSGS